MSISYPLLPYFIIMKYQPLIGWYLSSLLLSNRIWTQLACVYGHTLEFILILNIYCCGKLIFVTISFV